MTTISVTSEFREEFEAERAAWLRRRFLWYAGTFATLQIMLLLFRLVLLVLGVVPGMTATQIGQTVAPLPSLVLHIGGFFYVLKRFLDREHLIRLVYIMIVVGGVIGIFLAPLLVRIEVTSSDGQLTPAQAELARTLAIVSAILPVFVAHFFASLFIPWTPREAVRPLVPLLVCYALSVCLFGVVFGKLSLVAGLVIIALSPLVGVPGVTIAWWRHSRFRSRFSNRMLKRTYGEIKRELVDARRIHEALFPEPLETGPVHFHYVYEPMRQIGGDFLFARCVELPGHAQPLLNVVVIDVTGHGISAALTVNRLHGEIEREFGENPAATPGELLHGLNAYLHHTLARHSVYATALCLRVDPAANELYWASAGHPTAFVRTAAGRVDQLDSTTLLLGACRTDDFYANQQRAPFHPGDRLLIYTDGATEARNAQGRMLRTDGMQRLIASIDPSRNGGRAGGGGAGTWCEAVLQAIDEFRHGPAKDDTLVVEIARPI